MKRFCTLIRDLDSTNKTSERTRALATYFQNVPPADATWALFFLSGQRLKGCIKSAVFRRAALEASQLPAWMFAECLEAVGDLSETVSLILPEHTATFDEPLHTVIATRVLALAELNEAKAIESLQNTWSLLTIQERLVFNKLVRGNFRSGIQRAIVLRALSVASGVDLHILSRRFFGTFRATPQAFTALIDPNLRDDDSLQPFPFCLAHQLDLPLEELGDPHHWQIEHKWDGIRAQIIRGASLSASPCIWSRGEESIERQFPEIAAAARTLPPSVVLDGEILAWRFPSPTHPSGHPLSFQVLQQRLNRKQFEPSLFDAEGVVFVAFDLLQADGIDYRSKPLRERRHKLGEILTSPQVSHSGVLLLPTLISASTWQEVRDARTLSRSHFGAEGLMLKHLQSAYHDGRVAGSTHAIIEARADQGLSAGWWKWKVDPFTIDAVMIYAQQGSGRRAGFYTDYTFALWDPAPGGALVPFAKAYSGLTNEEIREVDQWIRSNTITRAGPVRTVTPHLVFEIGFEGVQQSSRHRSGIAVRFPRILRRRQDKTAAQADTLTTLQALLKAHTVR